MGIGLAVCLTSLLGLTSLSGSTLLSGLTSLSGLPLPGETMSLEEPPWASPSALEVPSWAS